MSNQRFPRMKYVRQLIRIENELDAWAAYLESQATYHRAPGEEAALLCRASELRVMSQRIHDLADSFHLMPVRQRELLTRALDRSHG